MNATMVASGTKAVPPVVSSIQDIPLGKIRESKTNPRRFFDETKLSELADNIRQHGVLQPILLRPLPEGEAGTFELVAGTRRRARHFDVMPPGSAARGTPAAARPKAMV